MDFKNVEIQTITETMMKKQTWVRNELKNFFKTWENITQDNIQGHEKFVLYEYTDENCNYRSNHRVYLDRGYSKIYKQTYNPGSGRWEDEDWIDIDLLSISIIKKIIKYITSGLNQYFQDIQNDIDSVNASGTAIRSLAEKLK